MNRLTLFLILILLAPPALAQSAAEVRPAADAVMAAFTQRPLVAIDDGHGLAQEQDFYAALVRDPRFAREVGNVVVEFGGAAAQPIMDRYLNGESVPYAELRQVWSQVVGWQPTVSGLGYLIFFAQVRAVNAAVPPAKRIRVWLGEPPMDWAKITTREQLRPIAMARDSHAAELITREILAKGKKALVIYGGEHLLPANAWALLNPVERAYPGAFFVIHPYTGYNNLACSEAFEQGVKAWPLPALATPVRDTDLARQLLRQGCRFSSPGGVRVAALSSATAPEVVARQQQEFEENAELVASGVESDAFLYLGPATSLTYSPGLPDLYLDAAFRAEIDRRQQLRPFGTPLGPVKMEDFPAAPKRFRRY